MDRRKCRIPLSCRLSEFSKTYSPESITSVPSANRLDTNTHTAVNIRKMSASTGKQAISALLSGRIRLLSIDEQILKWLQRLELIDSYRLQVDPDREKDYEFRLKKCKDGPEVRLTDIGLGVFQILPTLALCYYVPEGSILILEQPEAHLHPKAQADLADVLIDVVKNRNIQIILETHSEHLLRRLQRRIAEEEIPAADTALYFCQVNDGISEIERLNMDEYGNITNWPQDFFGDEMSDWAAKSKAEMKQRKANEL